MTEILVFAVIVMLLASLAGYLLGLHRGRMQGVDRAEAITKDDIAAASAEIEKQYQALRDIHRMNRR